MQPPDRGRSRKWWSVPYFLILVAALLAWGLWPDASGPAGPSVSERARQGAAPPDALSARVIAAGDLPPEGTRSLFDHLIAQNEQLPYPFEKLVALVQAQDAEGRAPLALLIPRGRSLLKASAHFERPRVLVAADFQAPNGEASFGLAARGRLFLGFVEDAAEIEVISYNEAAGRFEFQLVQDYREGGVPRIVYARRAICTTCHQGAAPIFPQRPWSETNANPEIARRIAAARGAAGYAGVPDAVALAVPERFDELTDVANFVPVTQRLWLDGCGDGREGKACRREMFKLAIDFAIDPGGFDGGAATQELRAMQARAWPAGGIAVADADIRNRDPLAEGRGLREWVRGLLGSRPREGAATPDEALAAFERLPKLPLELDPVAQRPPKRVLTAAVVDGVFGLAQFFTPDDVRLLERAAADPARRQRAIAGLPEALFEPAPFARVRLLNPLLEALRQRPRAYAFLDTAEMSPPQALGVPPLALAGGSALAPFAQYCFSCHRGNPARRLDFMSGQDEAEVLARIQATGAIRDALDWERYRGTDKEGTLMPPADSHQRRALEAALAQDPQLLEEMRRVVPALFDF
jgi:mono/diheme cytochrome c family protein